MYHPAQFMRFVHLRRVHLVVGALALLGFLGTGQYMDRVHGHLEGMADGPRLLFRSAHIYLLFSALLNLVLGTAGPWANGGWRRVVQGLGSLILLLTPVLFALAFFREPWLGNLDRPHSRLAIYGSLGGVLAHLIASLSRRRSVSGASPGPLSGPAPGPPSGP